MKRPITNAALVLSLMLILTGTSTTDESEGRNGRIRARLSGFQEVPAVSTTGEGEFVASLNEDRTMISYELSYSNLTGGTASAAHIHLGQRGVIGGVIAFLCGGGNKPVCPATSGTVTGTIVAADITGPAVQGIAAGEFEEALRAIRSGNTYVNVHTPMWQGGEIRGQVRGNLRDRDDDGDDDDD